ncbi:probable DNA polymerase X-putative [Sporisorium reilianum SRZ2]|uniref:Probable DNA polymerase X-putative n=1 Tax=Sporisorium reilianum (strain SRZ2) TaxID=999809 RepID=E6ZTW6_SPORE|nr:probable DNA polymerase X-putative [Sporisorium reilianum SRZ2]
MSSSGLQRLPNGTTRFRPQYRLVLAAVPAPASRQYTVQSGRTKHAIPLKLERAIAAILYGEAASPRVPLEIPSRLFEPIPRRFAQQDVQVRLQMHEQVMSKFMEHERAGSSYVTEDAAWLDVHDKSSVRTGCKGKAASVKGWTRPKPRVITLSTYRAKREKQHLEPTQQNIDSIMASFQQLALRQEAIDRAIRELAQLLNKQKPSLLHAAIDTVKQAPKALAGWLSDCYTYLVDVSEPAVHVPRPSRSQMAWIMLGAACYSGGAHVLAPLVRELVALVPEPSLVLQSLSGMLGFAVHTSSLPLLIALSPRTKNVFSHLRASSFAKRLFTSQQRRTLTSTHPTHGPRKEAAYRDLVTNHADVLDRPFPMAAVLDDLRNLQALRGSASSREYKVAERRLFRVQHESELGRGGALTVRQVAQLLQPDDSVGWTTIRQRLLEDRVDAIDGLSREDRSRVMFQRVYGIGATKAERFVHAGFLTLEQLRDASLERAQRIGLKHMDDIECLIPRAESERWREVMLDVFRTVDAELGAELLGSFRRGDHYSSDLDFVLFHPAVTDMRIPRADNPSKSDARPLAASLLTRIVDELRNRHLLADELLAHGPLAIKGLVRLSPASKVRRIDLNFAPFTRRAFYTLAKTGDADLMVHLRAKAKARGWALNEYGVGPPNANGSAWTENLLPDATDERQIFELLQVPYLEPEERSFAVYASKLRIVRP